MTKSRSPQLIRHEGNPILIPTRQWWERKGVFNAAAVVRRNKIYLLYRAVGGLPVSNFGLAVLSDPFTVEKRSEEPVLRAREDDYRERLGIEDCRVVELEGRYYLTYVSASLDMDREKPHSWSRSGTPWRIRLQGAVTHDFKKFIHQGVILPHVDTKDGTLFPEKIHGHYYLLHRPFPDIWISRSTHVGHFDKGEVLCTPRKGMWDNDRIGAGAPPIKTPIGWLEFYHGVQKKAEGEYNYMLGILLLDLDDPTKILYRSPEPILKPRETYERVGLVKNVVFTCGAIEWDDTYYVYYGGADTVICVAHISKKALLDNLHANMGKGVT